MEGDVWGAFAHDPRDPAAAPLRASDADREVIHGVLADGFATGRLDRAEYDERSIDRAVGPHPGRPAADRGRPGAEPAGCATSSGRVPLVAATSADIQRRAEEHWHDERRNAFFGFLGPTVICWTIWTATMLGGIPVAGDRDGGDLRQLRPGRVGSKREIIASEVKRLERKQAKELEKKQRDQ